MLYWLRALSAVIPMILKNLICCLTVKENKEKNLKSELNLLYQDSILNNKCFLNKINGKLNCSKNKIFINLQKKI